MGGSSLKYSSAEGVALPSAQRPVTSIVRAGSYVDCDLTCDIRAHLQMHVKVGVISNLTRCGTGSLQLLDERRISGNKILVLRTPRLAAPSMYRAMNWPCTSDAICSAAGGEKAPEPSQPNLALIG